MSCPAGMELDGGLCYPLCNQGYTGVGPVCWGICPSGFSDLGITCAKPAPYGRGFGHISKYNCETSSDHGASTNGCEENGFLWYPICDPNYHNVACCICSPNCPGGFTDAGEFCTKPSYGRGAGTIPPIIPPVIPATLSTIVIIVIAIFVFIIIVGLILVFRK